MPRGAPWETLHSFRGSETAPQTARPNRTAGRKEKQGHDKNSRITSIQDRHSNRRGAGQNYKKRTAQALRVDVHTRKPRTLKGVTEKTEGSHETPAGKAARSEADPEQLHRYKRRKERAIC